VREWSGCDLLAPDDLPPPRGSGQVKPQNANGLRGVVHTPSGRVQPATDGLHPARDHPDGPLRRLNVLPCRLNGLHRPGNMVHCRLNIPRRHPYAPPDRLPLLIDRVHVPWVAHGPTDTRPSCRVTCTRCTSTDQTSQPVQAPFSAARTVR
jgi:hypothetical protein